MKTVRVRLFPCEKSSERFLLILPSSSRCPQGVVARLPYNLTSRSGYEGVTFRVPRQGIEVGTTEMRFGGVVILMLLLVVGCGAEQPVSEPAPAPPPSATPTPEVSQGSAVTPQPTRTPIPAPESIPTPQPTSTPSPTVVRNLVVVEVTEDSITLRWEPPVNSDVSLVERYEVARDVSLFPDEHNFVVETTFTDLGLIDGTVYRYRVRAIGAGGTEGPEVSVEASTLESPTPEPTESSTPSPAATGTPRPTYTPIPTHTPSPAATRTPQPTSTPVPPPTLEPTETPVPEPTSTQVPEPTTTRIPDTPGTWYGLVIAPEDRCSPYDSDDYRYSQSVEARVVEGMGSIIYGPYTGTFFSSMRETDIEHIVARSEAHDSGLCATDAGTRRRFASDLLNLTLASPRVNRHQKSDNDAAEWLPDMNRCWFADRVIRVRQGYGLTIDQSEVDALDAILSGCSSFEMVVASDTGQASPTVTSTATPTTTPTASPTATPPATSTASPTATPPPSPTSQPSSGVDALTLWDDNGDGRITCAEARNHGIAPVRRGHPAYPYMNDGDGDGVVCE